MTNKQQNIVTQWIRENVMSGKVARHVAMLAVLVAMLGVGIGAQTTHAFAAGTTCSSSDTAYSVQSGDTLSGISQNTNDSTQQLASYNGISNPDLIFVGQTICIPGNAVATTSQPVAQATTHYNVQTVSSRGSYNPFPYGQCTYWADARYHQLHGAYVPWMVNSNAYQWVARARQYGWHVSSTPKVGSIMVLAPWVEGAWSMGHVAIVESIQGNSFTASSMNWNGSGSRVNYSRFTPGAGVSFITNY